MYLIAGLGNPGEKYKNSRHNVGFILLDEMLAGVFQLDKYARAEILLEDSSLFVKPQTFMNSSGESLKYFVSKKDIDTKNVIVIHDDVDLPFGAIKIVFAGGAGGHNGVRSIIDSLGTNEFVRIKIGIAPTDAEGRAIKPKPGFFQSQSSAVARFVLKDFSKADLAALAKLAPRIRDIIDLIISQGYLEAMNRFN